MVLDPYASCPCGSGKKFKWCCQPIRGDIDRALRQDAEGQHEAALKIMQQVVAQHPANPEAWGRLAQLLYHNQRVEEAENALQKAFDINPNYPFGHLLRGSFRYAEGEYPGALLLFRKAADLYALDAADQLAEVYALIGDCEIKLNRPVACRAALQIALRYLPGDEELRRSFDSVFGSGSHLPASARREYTFLSPASTLTGARRSAWDRVLKDAGTMRLSDAAGVFQQLTAEDANDTAAWYNLGLARAWLGDNRAALEALDRYVDLETDEARATAAWCLGEVLRLAHGMEDFADYREYAVNYQIRDPQPLVQLLQTWERNHRLLPMQERPEEGILSVLLLEEPSVLTSGAGAGQPRRLLAYVLVAGGLLRLRHPVKSSLDRACAEIQQAAGAGLSQGLDQTGHATFGDVILEALVFPIGLSDRSQAEQRVREHAEHFFEETWIRRPLQSLNQIDPLDAAGHRTLRKKLLGVIQFLQECSAGGVLQIYDFDRLRRKLGLLTAAPPVAETAPAAAAESVPADLTALGAAELAALQPSALQAEQLEQAYQAALRLDAQEVAARFARELTERPADVGPVDRAPWYFYLVQRALAEGDTQEALNRVDAGEHFDSEHNEGRRRGDFELRRGQVLVKRGDGDQARDVFARLLEREPGNQRLRGSAVEGMLSLRRGADALRFAEEGLAKARQQNDRDSEQYFQELVAAARKQG